ncbi:MAG: hypothetical protein ABIF77_00385 [bacterium]
MTETKRAGTSWWGDYDLDDGATAAWQVGPFRFWLARSPREWRFACRRGDDPLDDTLRIEVPAADDIPEDAADNRRIGFRHTQPRVKLSPRLADRPVVVNPVMPFLLPPGEELVLYISTALWLRIEMGEPLREFLDTPLFRPSDTWFGPNTREGELCYAQKTSARLQLENLLVRPHRVLSAVQVRNRTDANLAVEKIKLPLPNMSIFGSPDGALWTEVVTFQRREAGEHAILELSKKPPSHVKEARRLSGPREEPTRGLLMRAFGGLLGGGA